jgi:hypothetical protein
VSFSQALAEEIHQRSDGHCEACGGWLSSEGGVFHHRLLRSQGGRDTLANVMEIHAVCHNGHTGSIHSQPARSYRLGHLVRSGIDPITCAVIVVPDLLSMRS